MEKTFKQYIIKLGIFILFSALIPWCILLVPLLTPIFRQIIMLITVIAYPLFCLFNLVFGGAVILALPYNKLFRWLICIAWFPLYTLLCWGWATLAVWAMIQIFGHV